MRIAVGIATRGRPAILAAALEELARQTRVPDRVLVCHADVAAEGQRLLDSLRAHAPNIEQSWLMQAGAGIGAHAGPGALVVAWQELVPIGPPPQQAMM